MLIKANRYKQGGEKMIAGDKNEFAIKYCFFDDDKQTEISMFVKGKNILEFKRNGMFLTTKWDLTDIAIWLRNLIENAVDDPYPVEAEGTYAAIKDIAAREFDSEDDAVFDAYYDKLDEWNDRHRWHPHSNGGILADVYFQFVGDCMEISWNNQDDEVDFTYQLGGETVPKDVFIETVEKFLTAFANHWYPST